MNIVQEDRFTIHLLMNKFGIITIKSQQPNDTFANQYETLLFEVETNFNFFDGEEAIKSDIAIMDHGFTFFTIDKESWKSNLNNDLK